MSYDYMVEEPADRCLRSDALRGTVEAKPAAHLRLGAPSDTALHLCSTPDGAPSPHPDRCLSVSHRARQPQTDTENERQKQRERERARERGRTTAGGRKGGREGRRKRWRGGEGDTPRQPVQSTIIATVPAVLPSPRAGTSRNLRGYT